MSADGWWNKALLLEQVFGVYLFRGGPEQRFQVAKRMFCFSARAVELECFTCGSDAELCVTLAQAQYKLFTVRRREIKAGRGKQLKVVRNR